MFNIKIKVKGKLTNLTESKEEIIDTPAIKKEKIISYMIDDTKYKLIIDKLQISLFRENSEFNHLMIFKKNKTTTSEYYLKKYNNSLFLNIITMNLLIKNNKINITYKIKETETIYNYELEMSDNL